MHPWFVTYTTGPLDVRKTFEVDADTKADAIVLGDTLAAAWLRLHGLVPGDLRGDPADGSESAAARLSYCQPAPPAWVGIFGRRADDGHHTRVTTAPMVSISTSRPLRRTWIAGRRDRPCWTSAATS